MPDGGALGCAGEGDTRASDCGGCGGLGSGFSERGGGVDDGGWAEGGQEGLQVGPRRDVARMVARAVEEVPGGRAAKHGDGGVRGMREQSADDVVAEESAASDY